MAAGRRLLVVLGPTAVGKSARAVALAKQYGSPVISCDSRQLFREMRIGTAVPPDALLSEVPHYFIRDHTVREPYTAGKYEVEALALMERLWSEGHETLVMCGGSMFYIDAVCRGLDNLPDGDPGLREELWAEVRRGGLPGLAEELGRLDPLTASRLDLSNPQRVIRALEVCRLSGRPFSSFKTNVPKRRDFVIEKLGLTRPREELHGRIAARVEGMLAQGLVEEVRSLLPLRNLTALQTVGYREIFSYLDGVNTLEEAAGLIVAHTRAYAKRQMTWWKRDPAIRWETLSD